MQHLRVPSDTKGPRLLATGGTALLLIACAAAATAAAEDGGLPRAAWLSGYEYSIDPADNWHATLSLLDEKYGEPQIAYSWETAGFKEDRDETLLSNMDISRRVWQECTRETVSGNYVHLGAITRAKTWGAVFVRTKVTLKNAERLRIFFGADYFLSVRVNGREVFRGFFDGEVRAEAESVEVDFPAGTSEIMLVAGWRGFARDVYLRVGRVNLWHRRVAIFTLLQELFPDDKANVLAAQKEIVGIVLDQMGDSRQGEIELQRLRTMAGDNPDYADYAMRRLGEQYRARGRSDLALEVLRTRLGLTFGNPLQEAAGRRTAVLEFTAAARAAGTPAAAYEEFAEYLRENDDPSVRLALIEMLVEYSLSERARREIETLEGASLDKRLEDLLTSQRKALDTLSGNPAVLDIDHTATAKLRSAADAVAQKALERAALLIIEALDRDGARLVGSGQAASSTAGAVKDMLCEEPLLAAEYRKASGRSGATGRVTAGGMLLKRPSTAEAAKALHEICVEAVSRGSNSLAGLARDKLKEMSEAARGDVKVEALDAVLEAVDRARITHEQDLGTYATVDLTGGSLREKWRVPLAVSGIYRAAGSYVRDFGPALPAAGGVLDDDRLYVFDGAAVRAFDAATGTGIWEHAVGLPPGCRALAKRDLGSVKTVIGPPLAAVGGGRVYYSMRLSDDVLQRGVSYVEALDEETGGLLWRSRADAFQDGDVFTSAPVFAYDRVYVMLRRNAGGQSAYLACLDARDGGKVFAVEIDNCYMALTSTYGWNAGSFDPAAFCPPPAVADGLVYVCPGSGALAVIDALSGEVKSVRTYPRTVLRSNRDGLFALLAGRPPRAPAAGRDFAAAAPNDTAEAFVFGATGVVPLKTPGAREIIGSYEDTVIAILDGVCGVAAATGATLWKSDCPARLFMPGGAVAGDYAYVPAQDGLYIISAIDGRTVRHCPWPDGEARGNILLAGDAVIAFGKSDVAAMAISSADAAAQSGSSDSPSDTRARVGVTSQAGAGSGMRDFLLLSSSTALSVVDAEDAAKMAFVPDWDLACWSLADRAQVLWTFEAPFEPKGALTGPQGRFIVHDDWRMAAVDGRDGKIIWLHEAPGAVGEVDTIRPMEALCVLDDCISYIKDGQLVVVDAETGQTRWVRRLRGQATAWASEGGRLAIATATWETPDTLTVYDGASGEVVLVMPFSDRQDYSAGVVIDRGRAYVVCPNLRTAVCVELSSGRVLWSREKIESSGRDFRLGASGGVLYFTWSGDGGLRLRTLDIGTGADGGVYNILGAAGESETGVWFLDGSSAMTRVSNGIVTMKVPARMPAAGVEPVGWLETAGRLYILFGSSTPSAYERLWIARYDLATGREEAAWDIPPRTRSPRDARLWSMGRDTIIVSTREGLLKIDVKAGLSGAKVSVIDTGGVRGNVIAGEVEPPSIEAVVNETIVVDGDLADWRKAAWQSAGGDDSCAASVAFSYDSENLYAAIRVDSINGEHDFARGDMRLSLYSAQTSRVIADLVMTGEAGVSVTPLDLVPVICRIRTGDGGLNWEIAIPWKDLPKESQPGGDGLQAAALAGDSGECRWSWPGGFVYSVEKFGLVKGKQERLDDAL